MTSSVTAKNSEVTLGYGTGYIKLLVRAVSSETARNQIPVDRVNHVSAEI